MRPSYRGGFEDLWGEINGEDSWDTNPWVWRIEVKRVPAPLTLADVKDALAAGAEVRCAAERTKKRSPRR